MTDVNAVYKLVMQAEFEWTTNNIYLIQAFTKMKLLTQLI